MRQETRVRWKLSETPFAANASASGAAPQKATQCVYLKYLTSPTFPPI